MTTTIDGNSGIIFPNSTTQNISAFSSGKYLPANMPTGTVLQIISAYDNSVTSGSGNEVYAAIGLTATITPISTSSKIMIVANIQGQSTTNRCWMQIRRSIGGGSYSIISSYLNGGNSNRYFHSGDFYSNGETDQIKTNTSTWIDQPSTTSSVQYKFYMAVDSSGTWYNNSSQALGGGGGTPGCGSSCMLMEIAG